MPIPRAKLDASFQSIPHFHVRAGKYFPKSSQKHDSFAVLTNFAERCQMATSIDSTGRLFEQVRPDARGHCRFIFAGDTRDRDSARLYGSLLLRTTPLWQDLGGPHVVIVVPDFEGGAVHSRQAIMPDGAEGLSGFDLQKDFRIGALHEREQRPVDDRFLGLESDSNPHSNTGKSAESVVSSAAASCHHGRFCRQ